MDMEESKSEDKYTVCEGLGKFIGRVGRAQIEWASAVGRVVEDEIDQENDDQTWIHILQLHEQLVSAFTTSSVKMSALAENDSEQSTQIALVQYASILKGLGDSIKSSANQLVLTMARSQPHSGTKGTKHFPAPRPYLILLRGLRKLSGLETKGIFRVSGDFGYIHRVLQQVQDPSTNTISVPSVHILSSALKKWLWEHPPITLHHYDKAVQLSSQQASEPFHDFCRALAAGQWQLLQSVLSLLRDLETNTDNCMDRHALAVVFAPCLLKCPSKDPQIVMGTAKLAVEFLERLMGCFEEIVDPWALETCDCEFLLEEDANWKGNEEVGRASTSKLSRFKNVSGWLSLRSSPFSSRSQSMPASPRK